jgi:hypothetical protein
MDSRFARTFSQITRVYRSIVLVSSRDMRRVSRFAWSGTPITRVSSRRALVATTRKAQSRRARSAGRE